MIDGLLAAFYTPREIERLKPTIEGRGLDGSVLVRLKTGVLVKFAAGAVRQVIEDRTGKHLRVVRRTA